VKLAVVLTLSCGIAGNLLAQPKRILYITHSAGYRHDSLPVSADVMRSVASASGKLEVTATEDVSLLNAATLRSYDAVFFFTSGDLSHERSTEARAVGIRPQWQGFAGAHSATDTFYGWPEYGDLIGAYFNGHPWVQPARMIVEDASHPASAHLAPAGPFRKSFISSKIFRATASASSCGSIQRQSI
jgi:type 1 glutamine amidotransferase